MSDRRRNLMKTDKKPKKARLPPVTATSPLSRFLADIFEDDESRLASVATQMVKANQQTDLQPFRDELVAKLQRLQYPQPPERGDREKTTFHQHLGTSGCLEIVLRPSTLRELRNCLLIPEIMGRDWDLQRQNISAVGYPVPFHRKLYKEAQKRLVEIAALVTKYGETEWMAEHRLQIEHQFRENIKLVLLSTRYTGRRKELMSGQAAAKVKRDPRDESLAARVATYWVLRTRLRGNDKMSDRFVRQLSLLIEAKSDVKELGSDEPLRKAIEGDVLGWRQLLKITPQKT
jgi:hypothetical protein